MLKKRRRFADETRDEEKTENLVPLRDTSLLFASPSTVSCAYHCVPCAYKVGLFDVALDKEFCNQVPNQRPEQCRRASTTMQPDSGIILGFQQGMSVLTVGAGDLSYSLALARILRPKESNSVLSATSYEGTIHCTTVLEFAFLPHVLTLFVVVFYPRRGNSSKRLPKL